MEGENKTNYTQATIIGVVVVVIVGLLIWGFFVKSPSEVLAPENNIETNIPKTNSPVVQPTVPNTDEVVPGFDYKG